ncbi:carboxymuconolactone decarboxylase family protein [Nonomuraea sp. SYSU D8015]|uniref:carboxymuconolactone decarboxylase family protein n=1 Tax=Nonomuraea sp. SYSU D8015 TaxID=2593644 RepID=UPI00166022BA|nr:carboxymuconolactone decarboxylase family protein [Nonomuraea sp. SYSU D8015]
MSAVRLLAAGEAPLLARPYYGDGDPGPIVAALAHVPELLEVALPFIGAALGPSALSWRTKELVIVRVSALAGCRYCVQTHTAVALDAGLSREEILALRLSLDYREVFAGAAERAVIAWSDAVAAGHGPVSGQARDGLRAHFAEHETVELTVTAGATLMLNRLATALELPTSPGTLSRLTSEGLL